MALALLLLLWLMTLATAYLFALRWMPAAISAGALRADSHLQISLIIFGVVFVLAHVALGWMVWRHRERSGAKSGASPRASLLVEVGSLAVAALLFLGINLFAARSWSQHTFVGPARVNAQGVGPARGDTQSDSSGKSSAATKVVKVEITGQQFQWYFRYPGADGRFGATKAELRDASLGNPLGIDPDDAAGADDKVAAMLALPVGRDVEVTLHSQDVIHSFFAPELRLKQDAVPGMDVTIYFKADQAGQYEIVCAELCGQGHHQMNAKLKVLPEGEFTRWLAGASGEKPAGGKP